MRFFFLSRKWKCDNGKHRRFLEKEKRANYEVAVFENLLSKAYNLEKMTVFTIGHSTRMIEEFLSLLELHGIEALADVRAFPSSSKYPQFNRENLKSSLVQAGLEYHWLGKALGILIYPANQEPTRPLFPNKNEESNPK